MQSHSTLHDWLGLEKSHTLATYAMISNKKKKKKKKKIMTHQVLDPLDQSYLLYIKLHEENMNNRLIHFLFSFFPPFLLACLTSTFDAYLEMHAFLIEKIAKSFHYQFQWSQLDVFVKWQGNDTQESKTFNVFCRNH